MQIDKPTLEGRLLRRYKRFLADVELDGQDEPLTAHCPNTGSLPQHTLQASSLLPRSDALCASRTGFKRLDGRDGPRVARPGAGASVLHR